MKENKYGRKAVGICLFSATDFEVFKDDELFKVDENHTAQNNGRMSVEASLVLLYLKDEGTSRSNMSVTAGQIAVILSAFLLFGKWFGEKSWYRDRITIPVSLCISLVALYWTVERVFY